jgi:uncharacterized protein (DUF427 family)
MSTIIRENGSRTVLAEAASRDQVLTYEGNLYFDPAAVRKDVLQVTERTYTCPYKGTCHWVDFNGPDGRTVKDVAWVYASPKPGHEAIKDRYGFYAGRRGSTSQEDSAGPGA